MSSVITIESGQAHVWVADPGELCRAGLLSGYLDILSPAERERMGRFCFERDRLTFLAAHGLVRKALSSCVPSVPPGDWEFIHNEHGKPEIAAPPVTPALRFNISHTRGLVACLLTVRLDCGVDVETLDHVADVGRLAGRVLSPTEQARLLSAPAHAQRELFFGYWTLKEAYVKARGCGISIPLDKCTFEFRPEGISIRFDPSLNDDGAGWQFAQWSPTERHLLAVALRGGWAATCRVVRHELPPGLTT
jgi:4'-phosphopantetheinyl transferase